MVLDFLYLNPAPPPMDKEFFLYYHLNMGEFPLTLLPISLWSDHKNLGKNSEKRNRRKEMVSTFKDKSLEVN